MEVMKRVFVSLGILAACIALTTADGSFARVGDQKSDEAAKSQARAQTQAQEGVVLGHLQSRDKIVTIIRGPKGAVYTIKTKDGKTLADRLSEKALQAKYPGIYQQIKSGLAGNDATLRSGSVLVPSPNKR